MLYFVPLRFDVIKQNRYVLTFYLPVSALANVSLQICSTTLSNWPLYHSGRVRAAIFATSAFAKAVFVVLFERGVHEDLANFFLVTAALYFLVVALCSVFLRPVPLTSSGGFVVVPTKELNTLGGVDAEVKMAKCHRNRWQSLLTSPLFHLMAWPGALFHASCLTLINNVSRLSTSLGVALSDEVAIVTLSVSNVLVRLASGVFIDVVASSRNHHERVLSQIAVTALFACSLAVYLLFFENNVAMCVVMVTTGASLGAAVIFPISTLVHVYGKSFYTTIVCCYNVVLIAGLCFLQTMIGIIYDNISLCNSLTGGTGGKLSAKVGLLLILSFSVLTVIPHFINFLFVRQSSQDHVDSDDAV